MDLQSLKTFHESLRTAVNAKAPLALTDRDQRIGRLKIADIDRAQSDLNSAWGSTSESGIDLANDAVFVGSLPSAPQYRAALQAFDQTGSMLPVFEGLSVGVVAQKKVNQVFLRTVSYLCLLSLVAAIGMALFRGRVIPKLMSLRADIQFSKPIFAPSTHDFALYSTIGLMAFAVLFVFLLGFILTGGSNRVGRWFGGGGVVNYYRMSAAARIYEMLVAARMNPKTAFSVSSDLAAVDDRSRDELQRSFPENASATSTHYWCAYFEMSAQRKLTKTKTITPIFLTIFIGGTIALTYCVLIYWPVVSMLADLVSRARS